MGAIARNEPEIVPNVFLTAQSIVCDHIVKCFPKLVCNLLDLQFLPVDLVLYVVDSLVQLRYIHLAILVSIGIRIERNEHSSKTCYVPTRL